MDYIFEWDENKARENLKKHRVSFEEAATIFHDTFIATLPDLIHSDVEQRYVSIGLSVNGRLLVVVHNEAGEKTRIISCRRATSSERKKYEESPI